MSTSAQVDGEGGYKYMSIQTQTYMDVKSAYVYKL